VRNGRSPGPIETIVLDIIVRRDRVGVDGSGLSRCHDTQRQGGGGKEVCHFRFHAFCPQICCQISKPLKRTANYMPAGASLLKNPFISVDCGCVCCVYDNRATSKL